VEDQKSESNAFGINDCWNQVGVWGKTANRCPELERVIHCRNCPRYSAAGRRLLDRMPAPESRQEWTVQLAKEKQAKNLSTKSAFVFRAGGEWLALPASLIREVVDMGRIHTIPHRSGHILRGLVNIRGKLEVCVSIGGVLGLEQGERKRDAHAHGYATPERLVVGVREGQTIVFPVTEVRGHVHYTTEMLRELPVTVSGSKAVYTKGILCLEDRDIGFLEDEVLFRTLTRSLA
jgi:chemotaxis-related protein WspD